MPIYVHGFKLKKLTYYIWIAGYILTVSAHSYVYASDQDLDLPNTPSIIQEEAPTPRTIEFDQTALVGSAKQSDLSIYALVNPTIVGTYPVQVYLNDVWQGNKELEFNTIANTKRVEHCFSFSELLALNVDVKQINSLNKDQCFTLDQWIEGASSRLDSNRYRYELSIPQAFIKRKPRGEVPYELWDRGINAAFLKYDFNQQYTQLEHQSFNDRYLRLTAGLNFAGWQFRHNAVLSQYAHQGSQYDRINSYAQRAFPQYGALVTLGESFSLGHFMPSFAYTGLEIKSDDRMLSETQRGYAPAIRGVAQTNAMVEVRQNGQLIYQLSVQPGAFIIDDLFATGSGGDLEVTVRESNGNLQRFNVPFSTVNLLLRTGQQRYSVTAGELRQNRVNNEKFIQASYQRGLSNALTGYAATTLSEVYQAYQLGAAILTPLGAVSMDVTHADTDPVGFAENPLASGGWRDFGEHTGQNYRLMYNKTLLPSLTSLSLGASYQSNQGFYHFPDAVQARQWFDRGFDLNAAGQQKNQFNASVQQNLGENRGNLFLTASRKDYWGERKVETDYQAGYSNFYKNLNYSFSVQRVRDVVGQSDDHFFAMLTLPLNFKQSSAMLSQYVSDTGNGSSVNAILGQDREFNVNLGLNDLGYGHFSQSAGVQYRSPFVTTALRGRFGDHHQQYSANFSGSVLAHSEGISFSPEMVDTMVLVKAPDAAGAQVKNSTGLKIDRWGYAIIPYVTAYRINDVTLDAQSVAEKVELQSSIQQLAPYAGSITKVEFKTKKGFRLIIKSRQPNGALLPFAASVENEAGESVGVVAQGSQILLRTDQAQANLRVKWGSAADQQCRLSYQLDAEASATSEYQRIEEQCR